MYLTKNDVFIICYAITYMIVHFAWLLSVIAGEHSRVEFLTVINVAFVFALGIYVLIFLKLFTPPDDGSQTHE